MMEIEAAAPPPKPPPAAGRPSQKPATKPNSARRDSRAQPTPRTSRRRRPKPSRSRKTTGSQQPARPQSRAPNRGASRRSRRSTTAGDGHASAAAGPAVRRLARELGVDLRRVRPTGAGGRITDDDVRAHVRETNEHVAATRFHAASRRPAHLQTDATAPCGSRRCRGCGRRSPATCCQSYTTIPQLTNFDDADVTELEDMREQSKDDYADRGIKLTHDAVPDQGDCASL